MQAEERAEAEAEAAQLAERRLTSELEALERQITAEAEDAANAERQERSRELDNVRSSLLLFSLLLLSCITFPLPGVREAMLVKDCIQRALL